MSSKIRIRFPDIGLAEANMLAESLRDEIGDAAPGTIVERSRDDPTTQDFGATLTVLLVSPAVVAVARGIEAWIQKYRDVEIEIAMPKDLRISAKRITVHSSRKIIADVLAASQRKT